MNKREVLLSLLDPDRLAPYVPAAFFLHFGPDYREGQSAIDRHMAYFRATGMDFVKIQYEHAFPYIPEIQHPRDWQRMPRYGLDFYEAPLAVVKGLVEQMKHEALVLMTLYSPFMSAGHTTSDAMITAHLREDPELVKTGLEAITESLLGFVRACIDLGVDGFYASTQGAEAHRFDHPGIFASYIKPYDLALMEEINNACPFNILHVCDYCGGYDDLTPFLDYPGDVVNCALQVAGRVLSPVDAAQFFDRPFMGGMDRHGAIASGDHAAIEDEVGRVLRDAPERFILGADCTVPGDTDWGNLGAAIDAAHAYPRGG
jgi:uroporphyrinogen decarboxylase